MDTKQEKPTGIALIQERARNKVRDVFAEVFTDEELDAMLKAEIDAFFHKPAEKMKLVSREKVQGSYSNNHGTGIQHEFAEVTLSPFQLIVWEHCASRVKELLDKMCKEQPMQATDTGMYIPDPLNQSSAGFNVEYTELSDELEKRAEKMAKENVHMMFVQMFAGMFSKSKQDMMFEFTNRFGPGNY